MTRELAAAPDLAELAGAARDAGVMVGLFERPMPDAVSLAGLGVAYDIVGTAGGAAVLDAEGREVDVEAGEPALAADELWRRLAARLGGRQALPPAAGPVALGGMAFDTARDPVGAWAGFPRLLLRVPRLAVARTRGRTFASALDEGAFELLEPPAAFGAGRATAFELEPVRSPDDWMGAVAGAVAALREGRAQKVVLARELAAGADGPLAAGAVAKALRTAYPSCYTYLVAGSDGSAFVGASPELLIRRRGLDAVSQPMAGSVRRGADDAEDAELAERLRTDAKLTGEHALVPAAVARDLATFAREVAAGAPEVAAFTNIQHLATTVRARLVEPAASALRLAAALHPTPAVGGEPREAARRLISELEGMERGWYAGAAGWIDAAGDGEFAVAIRCGLLVGDGARLYAGNGIMPGSDPRSELEETEVKLRALTGALLG